MADSMEEIKRKEKSIVVMILESKVAESECNAV